MIKMKNALIPLIIGVLASHASAGSLTLEQKLSDFNQLNATIDSGYGPLRYKLEKGIVDPQILRNQFEAKIRATKTNEDFYYAILEYVASFQDGHFRAFLPTTYKASLPLITDLVENKVLITQIDRKQLDEKEFPFAIGDEIISIDGQPINAAIDELAKYVGVGNPLAQRKIASWRLFYRSANRLPVPKSEKVVIEIRRGTSSIIEKAELSWKFTGEFVDENSGFQPQSNRLSVSNRKLEHFNFDLLSNGASEWIDRDLDRNYSCNGKTRIAIPEKAKMLLEEPFVAYYHPTEVGNIGYVRIPDYSPRDANGKEDYKKRFEQYQWVVKKLEENTVGLIIDQDHNCGGSVIYLEYLLGLFMDKPYQPMQFQLLGNKREYLQFHEWMEEKKNTIAYDPLASVLALIKNAWLKGEFMTPKTSLDGTVVYQPNPIHYSKPIVVLIDELAGSGGDAFPSLIQGYGRAKLLGTRTMGLGGHVEDQPALFYSQIEFDMTKSLFYRPDGVPVENNGAAPDFQYLMTRNDILYGFKEYQAFYLKTLTDLIKKP